jgi:quercetin dioxygenase-like cupin family protein
MDTALSQYLTVDPDASTRLNQRKGLYAGPRHVIDDIQNFPSVSTVVNESTEETGVSVAQEHQQAFDEAWQYQLQQAFASAPAFALASSDTTETDQEFQEFETTGKSNGYKLGLQIMVLAPGKYFKIHSHPNIEFEYTMLGTLREFRWLFRQPAEELQEGKELTGPEIAATHMFEEKVVQTNQCMINETGSVHQSFTSPDQGCIILVLWSGCHANTHPSRVLNRDTRLKPSAGW